MQVYARVDGVIRRSVLPCRNIGNGPVGIQIAVSRVLRVVYAAAIQSPSGRQLVAPGTLSSKPRGRQPGQLPRQSVIVLYFFRVNGDRIAPLIRVVLFKGIGNTAPLRKRRIRRRRAARREAGITCGSQDRLLRCVRLVNIIAE